MVDFLLYAASLEASVATRSKMSAKIVSVVRVKKLDGSIHTVDERVQDGHGTVGNTSVWVNLLEDWRENVNGGSDYANGWSSPL
jgi:hypothetical protein